MDKAVDVNKLPKVKSAHLTQTQKADVDDLVVVSRSALKELGLTEDVLERMLDADVMKEHKFMTCGDYNL
jgi:hypothetical protein